MVGLVDFYKSQCFFSATLQITAIIVYHQSISKHMNDDLTTFDALDPSLLVALASSGLFPVTFAFACIARRGHHSWYVMILSCTTFMLATVTLALAFSRQELATDSAQMGSLDVFAANTFSSGCPLACKVSEIVYPICGTSSLAENYLPGPEIAKNVTWSPWACCCLAYVLMTFDDRIWRSIRLFLGTERLQKLLRSRIYSCWRLISQIFVPIVACSVFIFQILLFYIYLRHDLFSQEWTFGQIIAVTVWAPSIIEFLYIELGKSYSMRR